MNVLVGVDGSTSDTSALEEALQRARSAGDDVAVAIYGADDDLDAARDTVEATLESHDVAAEIHELQGEPGSGLVDLAERGEFDRLVIGGGSRSPMGKIRIDEATEFVLLNATTTVTLIR